ncbi:MAG: NTP transferase domain-containing protein [Alphaproteobacteria bacterium]|nr:NTP transferase domain-containing protein [Alphaproteobacteria bacterium]
MKFGETPLEDAIGAILAHSVRTGKTSLKKGRILLDTDIALLRSAGVETVVAARLEPDDVDEDTAAARIATAAAGGNLEISAAFTGRVNLYAKTAGIVDYDLGRLNAINLVDESATVALLPPYQQVAPRQMVATVKIIPFAAPEAVVAACEKLASGGLVRVAPYRPRSVGLVQSSLPGTKESVLDKTTRVLSDRVTALGGTVQAERRCVHRSDAIRAEIETLLNDGCEMVLIAGASAITDRRDVIPAAIVEAGGAIDHFGMPVDPGNLLLLGHVGDVPTLGLPGCARSPKLNGADWVLQRLFADIPITGHDVMAMGAGGLLKEIPARPLPRAEATKASVPSAPKIAAIILAAGQSRRMGTANKLLIDLDGKPMVVRVAEAVSASQAALLITVLGHEAGKVRAALDGEDIRFADNPHYADGLSTSLAAGLEALPEDVDGVLICLGDMPRVSSREIDRLIAAFDPLEGRAICVPTYNGKQGNPILLARRFFGEMLEITGDRGARHLIDGYQELTCEVEMTGDSVLVDVDTPKALEELRA